MNSDQLKSDQPYDLANQQPISGWRRYLYLGLAGLFFVIGALGIVLPALPTTPFLLLTSYFLVRSSPRLHNRLMKSRTFGPILRDWDERGGVRRHIKIKAIGAVILAVTFTIWVTGAAPLPTVAVVVGSTVGIGVILRLKTIE